ncbi:MAG: hypothetical protein ACPGJI_08550 [Kangiellaceae bacterium]
MNIGEIKKPSVDSQLIKPKQEVSPTTAIAALKPVGDQVDISVKAKERFVQYEKNRKKTSMRAALESDSDEPEEKHQIDFTA